MSTNNLSQSVQSSVSGLDLFSFLQLTVKHTVHLSLHHYLTTLLNLLLLSPSTSALYSKTNARNDAIAKIAA